MAQDQEKVLRANKIQNVTRIIRYKLHQLFMDFTSECVRTMQQRDFNAEIMDVAVIRRT
jgi:hypothetical protein